MSWISSKDLFLQLASAVAHCHSHDFAHGQLRAEHVLLGGDGEIRLIGFCNRISGAHASAAAATTQRASDVGMSSGDEENSPSESGESSSCDDRPLDALVAAALRQLLAVSNSLPPAADVWSVAVLLVVMLTGARPFAHRTRAPKARALLEQ